MVSAYKLLQYASYGVLVPVFVLQLFLASRKLSTGQPSTFVSRKHNSNLTMPAIQICDGVGMMTPAPENSTLVSLYNSVKDTDLLHKVLYVNVSNNNKLLNLLDPEVLETSFGMSLDDAFETRYQFWDFNEGHIAMTKCMILKSFLIVQPAMFSQVHLMSDLKLFLSFHEQDQITHGYTKIVGNEPFMEGAFMSEKTSIHIEVTQKHVTRLSKAKMECTEDNSERLKVCVDEYVRGQMNCTLPWQEGDKRICDTDDDMADFRRVARKVYGIYQNIDSILESSGCRVNCLVTEYSARNILTMKDTFGDRSNFTIMLVMPQQATVDEIEIETYDGNNFVADTGGFLGLLLGLSIMDLIRALGEAVPKLQGKKNEPLRLP